MTEALRLPDVLSRYVWKERHLNESPISVQRALLHIKEVLLENLPDGEIACNAQAALDDLDTMIDSFKRREPT